MMMFVLIMLIFWVAFSLHRIARILQRRLPRPQRRQPTAVRWHVGTPVEEE